MGSTEHSLDDLRIERPPERSGGRGKWGLLLLLLLLVGGVGFWWLRPQAMEVQTAVAREVSQVGTERTVLNASGYVVARRAATVSSKVTGKVVEVLIEEGQKVQRGQVLARLDDSNIQAEMKLAHARRAAAEAALDETRVRIHEAELELQRVAQLAKGRIASQSDLDRAQAQLGSLKARLVQQTKQAEVAVSEIASWQQQLEDTVIRAPFAGVVTSKNAQPGEMISPVSAGGGFTRTGICTIVDMDSLEVEVDVSESYINRVSAGQPVEAALDAYPTWKIPARVIAIVPTADRQKSTVRVRVGFDKLDPRILPQMSIKVGFRDSAVGEQAPFDRRAVVPAAAITEAEGKQVVMVVRGGTVERRAVSLSEKQGMEVIISAGLSPGERVVINAPNGLVEGARIRESQ